MKIISWELLTKKKREHYGMDHYTWRGVARLSILVSTSKGMVNYYLRWPKIIWFAESDYDRVGNSPMYQYKLTNPHKHSFVYTDKKVCEYCNFSQ